MAKNGKDSERKKFLTSIKGHNTRLNWRNLPIYNPKPLLPKINWNIKFKDNRSEMVKIETETKCWRTDRRTDTQTQNFWTEGITQYPVLFKVVGIKRQNIYRRLQRCTGWSNGAFFPEFDHILGPVKFPCSQKLVAGVGTVRIGVSSTLILKSCQIKVDYNWHHRQSLTLVLNGMVYEKQTTPTIVYYKLIG